MTSRLIKTTALIGLIILASGCTVKMAYGLLDWLILWKVEQFVDLEGNQEDKAKAALDDFHVWHRKTQLPQYIEYLTDFKKRINSSTAFTSNKVHDETDKLQILLDQSLNQLKPQIKTTIASLNDEQCAELLKNIAKENEKYEKKYVNISERKQLKKRIDELEDNLKPWLGHFTDEQNQWISDWARQLKPYEALTARQQRQWHAQLEKMLEERTNSPALTRQLDELMFYRTDNWEQDIQESYDFNQTLTYELIARIFNNLSQKQREKFNKKLDAYIEDFEELHQKLEDDLEEGKETTKNKSQLQYLKFTPFAARFPYLARANG